MLIGEGDTIEVALIVLQSFHHLFYTYITPHHHIISSDIIHYLLHQFVLFQLRFPSNYCRYDRYSVSERLPLTLELKLKLLLFVLRCFIISLIIQNVSIAIVNSTLFKWL